MLLSFEQARECVYIVYTHRGYIGAQDFIDMLLSSDLINISYRANLNEMLTTIQVAEIERKRQLKFAHSVSLNKSPKKVS